MPAHDQNFKNLILDYPRQSLEFFAPAEAKHIPADATITPVRQELLKERLGDRFFEMDVPLQVDWKDGSREALVFCIEEESDPDQESPLKHAVYCIQLAQLLKTRRIVPVAIYPFKKRSAEHAFTLSGDFGVYLEFRGISIRLKDLDARAHFNSGNIVERLCLPLMRHERASEPEIVANAHSALIMMEPSRELRLKYFGFVTQYAEVKKAEMDAFYEQIKEYRPFKEDCMSLYDSLIAEGVLKGEAKGKALMILNFFESGVINADQARASLEQLFIRQEITQEIHDSTLAKINTPKA